MSAIERLPSLRDEPPMDEARFLKFLEGRSEDERWELIDGKPIQMMTPASKTHNRIAANLERLLNRALENAPEKLDALREVPLAPTKDIYFRAIADLAVVSLNDERTEDDRYFFGRFFLAAEVLSATNTLDHIRLKRHRYAECAACLYVLIVAQTDVAVEVWSRVANWEGRVLRQLDDRIDLPELGFSCAVRDLYTNTDFA